MKKPKCPFKRRSCLGSGCAIFMPGENGGGECAFAFIAHEAYAATEELLSKPKAPAAGKAKTRIASVEVTEK